METLNSDVDEPTGSAEALVHELFAWNAYLTTRYSSLSHSDATDASSRLLACLQGIESHAGAKALLRTELRLGTIKGYDFFFVRCTTVWMAVINRGIFRVRPIGYLDERVGIPGPNWRFR